MMGYVLKGVLSFGRSQLTTSSSFKRLRWKCARGASWSFARFARLSRRCPDTPGRTRTENSGVCAMLRKGSTEAVGNFVPVELNRNPNSVMIKLLL